jgi:hypothetical protein
MNALHHGSLQSTVYHPMPVDLGFANKGRRHHYCLVVIASTGHIVNLHLRIRDGATDKRLNFFSSDWLNASRHRHVTSLFFLDLSGPRYNNQGRKLLQPSFLSCIVKEELRGKISKTGGQDPPYSRANS